MAAATFDSARRGLFLGNIRTNARITRPPWALSETEFVSVCERCDDCVRACPAHIIERGSGGFPELSFAGVGCDFCGDCLIACRGRALRAPRPDPATAFHHRIRIAGQCLAEGGVGCQVCGDFCDSRALRFRPRAGGPPRPELDLDRCTGCGQCVAPCPVNAISVSANPVESVHG